MVVNLLANLEGVRGFFHHSKKKPPRLRCRPMRGVGLAIFNAMITT